MTYLEWANNRWRHAGIVIGVVVFHIAIITAVANWRGWIPKPVPILIRVNIYPDTVTARLPAGHRFSAPP